MKLALLLLLPFLGMSCSSNQTVHKSVADKKSEIYYETGTEKLINKDYTTALKYFLKADELKPKDTKIQNNLAMAYWFKGETEKAIQHLNEAIDVDERNSDARNNLASIYYQQKKYDLSLIEYRKVTLNLTYNKQYRTYYNMALIFNKKGEEQRYVEYLEKSIKEKRDYCPAHYELGKVYYNNKRLNLALEEFHQSMLGTCFQNPGPAFWKAKTLAAQGRYFKAKQKFKDLIKDFPKTGYVKKAYQEIQSINRKEQLSVKVREQNYRYKNKRNSLQSKQEQPVNLETPDF